MDELHAWSIEHRRTRYSSSNSVYCSTNGLLRMIRKPDCTSLQLNPFNIYVSSTSIFNSAERTQRPLTVTIFGKNCFRKLQRKVSWTASVGTRVLRLKDFIHEEDPASLRLRDTPWRKYFRFDAKSDYLVLRKSLLRLQENTDSGVGISGWF